MYAGTDWDSYGYLFVAGETVNTFLNENAQDIIREVKPQFAQEIDRLVLRVFSEAIGALPVELWESLANQLKRESSDAEQAKKLVASTPSSAPSKDKKTSSGKDSTLEAAESQEQAKTPPPSLSDSKDKSNKKSSETVVIVESKDKDGDLVQGEKLKKGETKKSPPKKVDSKDNTNKDNV